LTQHLQFEFDISDTHPALSGHFPGRPLVPGALLLAEISNRLEQSQQVSYSKLVSGRFVRPVLPNDIVIVECLIYPDLQLRFECKVRGKTVARGIFSA
jgi:3-hydroxyacyl-[acyl-carrier-protein] dehydratase